MPSFPPLPCEKIVYRTITRAGDFRDGRPLASAFHRKRKDTDGLSVDYDVTVPDGCAPMLSGKRAIVSLHVGRLRDISLDVIPDSPSHANIVEVPFNDDPDQIELVEQLAGLMVEQSRTVWTKDGMG